MKLGEFEKRHGKVGTDFRSHYWQSKVAQKYGLADFTKDTDLPAHLWHIMQNMSKSLYSWDKTEMLQHVQDIFKYMSSETRKEVRDLFLVNMDGLYFASYWGFFNNNDPKGYSERDKKELVKVLKTIKNGYKKYRYTKPGSAYKSIDNYIIRWGGAKNPVQQKDDFARATAKLKTASKLPRKVKKQVQKAGFFSQLVGRSK